MPTIENYRDENTFLNECIVEKFKKADFHSGDHMMGYTNAETNAGGRIIENVKESISDIIKFPFGIPYFNRGSFIFNFREFDISCFLFSNVKI